MAMASAPPPGYLAWRRTVPWSDEAIAEAMESEACLYDGPGHNPATALRLRRRAARVRAGHLSTWDVRRVADILIKRCFCGKKALYRTAFEGRCSAHRLDKSPIEMERIARKEKQYAELEEFRAGQRRRDHAYAYDRTRRAGSRGPKG